MKKFLIIVILGILYTTNTISQELEFTKNFPQYSNAEINKFYEQKYSSIICYTQYDETTYSILQNEIDDTYYLSILDSNTIQEKLNLNLDFFTDKKLIPFRELHDPIIKKLKNHEIISIELFKNNKLKNTEKYYFYLYSLKTEQPILFAEGSFFTYADSDRYFYASGPNLFEIFIDENEEITTIPVKTNFKKNEEIIFFKSLNDFYICLLVENFNYSVNLKKSSNPFYSYENKIYYICKEINGIIKKDQKLPKDKYNYYFTDVKIKSTD